MICCKKKKSKPLPLFNLYLNMNLGLTCFWLIKFVFGDWRLSKNYFAEFSCLIHQYTGTWNSTRFAEFRKESFEVEKALRKQERIEHGVMSATTHRLTSLAVWISIFYSTRRLQTYELHIAGVCGSVGFTPHMFPGQWPGLAMALDLNTAPLEDILSVKKLWQFEKDARYSYKFCFYSKD